MNVNADNERIIFIIPIGGGEKDFTTISELVCLTLAWLHNQLNKDILYHVAVHVGETKVATLVAVGKFAVINTELVQDGGVEVMDVHRAWRPLVPGRLGLEHIAVGIGNVVAVIVSATVGDPRLDASAGHPD